MHSECSPALYTRFEIISRDLNYNLGTKTRCAHVRPHLPKRGQEGIEPSTSPTLRENHTTRPLALIACQLIL